jgi:Flp pilus assembly CpaE family ATPase
VREAIDRGVPLDELKPGNKVTAQIRKLILSTLPSKVDSPAKAPLLSKLKLATSR